MVSKRKQERARQLVAITIILRHPKESAKIITDLAGAFARTVAAAKTNVAPAAAKRDGSE